MRLISAVEVEGEFVDVFNEEGELTGEDFAVSTTKNRDFWICDECGAEWPA